ncbi:hypothetical protein ACFOSS_14345 [Pseudaeromonas sharmana]|jgi:hypothetical protein|uniref:Uncharacterized protein n=1 Tax=Pseudaeromonas sharmana TaxID=328412 RepID=A0ABV8CR38_9GAMM
MSVISDFLSDPIVSAIGYFMTVVSGAIAIAQSIRSSNLTKEINNLKNEISVLQQVNADNIEIKEKVVQGEKSQYFKDNSGPISIDNRG